MEALSNVAQPIRCLQPLNSVLYRSMPPQGVCYAHILCTGGPPRHFPSFCRTCATFNSVSHRSSILTAGRFPYTCANDTDWCMQSQDTHFTCARSLFIFRSCCDVYFTVITGTGRSKTHVARGSWHPVLLLNTQTAAAWAEHSPSGMPKPTTVPYRAHPFRTWGVIVSWDCFIT